MKKFINQEDMKSVNERDVFSLIKDCGKITRREIESQTGLSWGAVSYITARLIESGFVVEKKAQVSAGRGRTPYFLEVEGDKYCTLGIDVNIMGIHAEAINLHNEVLRCWDTETKYSDKEELLQCIVNFIEEILDSICGNENRKGDQKGNQKGNRMKVIAIGLAMQGIVDVENKISVSLSQCPGWENVPLGSYIEEKYSIPVYLEHDPNCVLYAFSEKRNEENKASWESGCATRQEDTILLRLDRSLGMSIMLDGKILTGLGRYEIAHMLVTTDFDEVLHNYQKAQENVSDDNAFDGLMVAETGQYKASKRKNSYGGRKKNLNNLESLASVSGLEKTTGKSFHELVELACRGDSMAVNSFNKLGVALGQAVYNLRQLFNVKKIVLCGELIEGRGCFIPMLEYINPDAEFMFAEVKYAAYGVAMLATRNVVDKLFCS